VRFPTWLFKWQSYYEFNIFLSFPRPYTSFQLVFIYICIKLMETTLLMIVQD